MIKSMEKEQWLGWILMKSMLGIGRMMFSTHMENIIGMIIRFNLKYWRMFTRETGKMGKDKDLVPSYIPMDADSKAFFRIILNKD